MAASSPEPVPVTLQNGTRSFVVQSAESGALLSISDFVAALGGSSRSQPGASVAAELSGHRIVAADGVSTVAFDQGVIVLSRAPRQVSGSLLAPWEFFERTVLPAAGLAADYDRPARRIRIRPGATASVNLDVGVVHLNRMTQVIFRASSAVPFEAAASTEGFTITFKAPVSPAFTERTFDDPFLSKIRFSPGAAHAMLREPGLTINPYALKNPDRIVVEVIKPEPPAPPRASPPAVAAPAPLAASGVRTVVIDPGHGGEETGAVGPGSLFEKDVTLDIATRLSGVLARESGVKALLTRTSDSIVALDERAAIANHEKAAVFLSIHANSSRAPGAHGSETYYLSLSASDKLAEAAAREENASADLKKDGPAGSESTPALDFILWDMAQSAHLKESAGLAESIQNELNALLHTENRGIKQAPFRVLVGASMPAVLVETAFISNPDEARRLATPEFRQSVAEAISRAVVNFLKLHPPAPAVSP
jgi:N-acetylmuramoyl-L-alanine amidase